jgi:glycosyltransferase involved in cell wall biosynthesis
VKILQISPTYSGIGGIAQHVRGLENYLKQTDNLVDVLSSDNSFTLPIKGLKNPSFMLSSSLKVKFMKKYDIIHAHNIPSAKAMKNAKGKKILSLHGIFSQQVDELHGKTTGTMSKKYENNALKWADAITVVSKEAFDYYVNLGYPVFQIPNAIDISSLTSNKDRRYQKQIIFAGRLSHEKGINLLIELAHKLPFESDLIILGSGPEEKRIQNLIKTQKNVHFLGYQNKEKTISLIRGSDLLIQPSLQEGISSTILEAMACNTLVVATNIGGNKELITDNETGFLVNSNSTSQIIEKINYVLSNPLKSKVITNNAFTYVKQYDWNVIGKKYLNLYQKILD